ncbi:MAG: DUF1501 domain-containing protein [Armatimonadetes bacterium]|nr:DUF1501 domain-containing protein [Armatimonadota bacterium]
MQSTEPVRTRREFLGRGLTLAAAAATVPSFLTRAAFALDDRATAEAPQGGGDQPVLVVLQLAGGNDGLNTLVPFGNDAYRQARPSLALPTKELLRLNDELAFHPALRPLKALYDEGHLAVVQGVGYPNPDRSHFRSMEIWETASDSDRYERLGWLGRYFDNHCQGEPEAALCGMRLGRQMPQAFANLSSLGISLQRPEQYRWLPSRPDGRQEEVYRALSEAALPGDGALDFLQRTALNANLSSDRILALAKGDSQGAYPDSALAQDLKVIAQMIGGGLSTRVYYASLGGFDTHAQQADEHAELLADLTDSLAAFLADLRARRVAERVVVMAFSEFGRRVEENASGGTDHGAAGLMFLAGDPIKPGLLGRYPSLTDLERGDLRHTVDFRQVYATILNRWLQADASKVLGRSFAPLDLLA